MVLQDKKTPVEEDSVAAEILAPVPKEPTEAPAPTPAEMGISLSTSQGSSFTFPRALLWQQLKVTFSNKDQTTVWKCLVVVKHISDLLSDVDGLITQALLTGNFEGAVELCLHDNRMADSIILAIAGGPQLLEKTQKKYFTKTHSKITKVISCILFYGIYRILDFYLFLFIYFFCS